MGSREKLRSNKCEEMTNEWNHDTNYTLRSLAVLKLRTFKRLIFVALKFNVKCELKYCAKRMTTTSLVSPECVCLRIANRL